MYIPRPDRALDDDEWRAFVDAQGFGHLAAAGVGREVPVVVPTQYVRRGTRVLLHLATPNPLLAAVAEQPRVVLSVAGDWAYIPSDWKAVGDEDPALGIPTTYYAAVQLEGVATVVTEPSEVAAVLRDQLADLQPDVPVADPAVAHRAKLAGIRAISITVDTVRAKFKYGGNVDDRHRREVIARLRARGGTADAAAAEHAESRGARADRPEPGSG